MVAVTVIQPAARYSDVLPPTKFSLYDQSCTYGCTTTATLPGV